MFFNNRQYLIKRYVNDEKIKAGLHGNIKCSRLLNNISCNGKSCKLFHRFFIIVALNSYSQDYKVRPFIL